MIGVFLCDCGTNIASGIDMEGLASGFAEDEGVRVYRHAFMCSRAGQDLVRGAVARGEVDRVVVAACSPKHHGEVFRRALEGATPSVEPVMANIREQCAWVTPDRAAATDKALALVRAAVARAGRTVPIGEMRVPVEAAVAVIGGGISGMRAALELASGGVRVHLIERAPSLGGVMAQLDRTFPTDDCALCSIAPVLSDVSQHPGIEMHALTDVVALRGRPGAWELGLVTRPRHVDPGRCTACGECLRSEHVPAAPLLPSRGRTLVDRISIDRDACTLCGACVEACARATGGAGAPALSLEGEGDARRVAYDTRRCVGCWECIGACPEGAVRRLAVCPVVVPREWDAGLGWRGAIHIPHAHAVPLAAVRDPATCLALTGELPCVGCERACPAGAVVAGQAREWALTVGAIVVAAGLQEADLSGTEYHPELPGVVTSLQLERLLSPDGPTAGALVRPSDGRRPGRVVLVLCAGSRSERHHRHCSRVCCSHSVKNAALIKASWPDVDVVVCYTDLRVSGPGAEERLDAARAAGVRFVRGSVAEVDRSADGARLVVRTEDTLAGGGRLDLEADLVVLATALVPSDGARALAGVLPVATHPEGFIRSVHPKMEPVDTGARGIYIAGSVESPKFIQECIAEATAAAGRAGVLVRAGELALSRAWPDLRAELCIGCMACVEACAYDAIEPDGAGKVRIVEASCRACGKCAAECPASALDLRELPDSQLRSEVDAALAPTGRPEEAPVRVVAFSCSSCGYNAADLAGARRLAYDAAVLPVWVPCSGRLSVGDLLHPFAHGASGVLVAACLPDQCAFIDGNLALADRVEVARDLLARSGVDPARLRVVHTSSADAEGFRTAAEEMARRARGGGGGA